MMPRKLRERRKGCGSMDLQTRLDILTGLAEELGLAIRREPLGGAGGGFCQIKGQRILFIDTMGDVETRYERTLEALAGLPEIEQRFVPPEIREDIIRQRVSK
ncbi:MAG: hypothetical protein AABZ08_05700 [Planctomycetota bacterium]